MLPSSKSSLKVKAVGMHGNLPKSPTNTTAAFFDFRIVSFNQFAWAFLIVLFHIGFIVLVLTTTASRAPTLLTTAAQLYSATHPQVQQQQQQEGPGKQVIQQLHAPPSVHHPDDVVDHVQCRYGKVYVYDDLPPIFNKKLLEGCRIDHREPQCVALSNRGFGAEAAAELARIVPPELSRAWYWTHMFAGDVIFHNRILNYKCRTMEPKSAAAFYVPFYAGLAASNILFSGYTAKERDAPFYTFLEWIKDQYYWKRSNGSDHFLALSRTSWDFKRARDDEPWGTSFLLMPLMRKMFSLTLERSRQDPTEVSVPYPTGFHPSTFWEIEQWQEFVRSRKRSSLFTFVGGKRGFTKNDFRALLMDHCNNESDSCKAVDCARTACLDGSTMVLEAFLDSEFCLQPRGDSLTRRSIFDCMLAGSIPVFFWKETVVGQYELFMSGELESFSVFIHRNKVRNGTSIRKILEGYSGEDIKRMREMVIDMIPRISYGFPGGELGNDRDAFDVAVEEVLRRIVSN
ncbi:xyloglucan galactosyltransferase XLT2-like [Coffea arabica]|uniref:Xyloglucan galactosyltransferase XLT2-like n=1 Tax=Coffea arabica TaxID=13443 RepID=A0A6P6SAK3_COFAR|nr:xyloglucan galactosyltransferase XLT2-like [Coffea arabica]